MGSEMCIRDSLRPEKLKGFERRASTIRGAFKLGEIVDEIPKVDLAVIGSVAVDLDGNRLGKGGGYGDREIKMVLSKNPNAVIATTVHPVQVLESVPSTKRDQKVDLVVTPNRAMITVCGRTKLKR